MGRIKPFGDERMLSVLQGANSILLCTHRSPDGDAACWLWGWRCSNWGNG